MDCPLTFGFLFIHDGLSLSLTYIHVAACKFGYFAVNPSISSLNSSSEKGSNIYHVINTQRACARGLQ